MPEGQKHLLLVDDEAALREAIAERLADHGFVVEQAASGEAGAANGWPTSPSTSSSPTCGCPASTAAQVIDAALERYPDIIAIVITGYGTVKDAVDAIKRGAADFVTKPFQFDELLHVLDSALEQRRLRVRERLPARRSSRSATASTGSSARSRVDARPVSAARDRRGDVEHGADHRRDRHRQGARRARDSPQQPAPRATGSSRSTAARFPRRCSRRAVRPRARRVHRRGRQRGRDASSRRTRARCSSTRSGR